MTIVTIPNKSLIRWIPPGDATAKCRMASLARLDSSRILMTYEAAGQFGVSDGLAACYLDEEFIVDTQSNALLNLAPGAGNLRPMTFHIFQDWKKVYGISCDVNKSALVEIGTVERPVILSTVGTYDDRNLLPVFPFVWNGSMMALIHSHRFCLALFHGEAPHSYMHPQSVSIESSVDISGGSGFVPSGNGWVKFLALPLTDGVGIFQARLAVDPIRLDLIGQCALMLRVDWLGTPMRHNDGWALPFDDGSGVCKIALIADSEISATSPSVPETP